MESLVVSCLSTGNDFLKVCWVVFIKVCIGAYNQKIYRYTYTKKA